MATSLKDLADHLGLSQTTISRALNGYSDVSARTRDRVFAAARDLKYIPSRAARDLAAGRTDCIGLVLTMADGAVSEQFFSEFVFGLSETFLDRGLDLIVSAVPADHDEMDSYHRLVAGKRVDAMVVLRTSIEDPRIDYLLKAGIPFVAHGRTGRSDEHAWVDTDGRAAFHDATRRLIDLGHRRIAHLRGHDRYFFVNDRRRGFQAALREAGIPANQAPILPVPMSEDGGYIATRTLLGGDTRPTAILCEKDTVAIGAMKAAQDAGFQVPQDLTIVGFDDMPLARHVHPQLTTIRQPLAETARIVADLLGRQLRGAGGAGMSALVATEFVARGSHGPAPHQEGAA